MKLARIRPLRSAGITEAFAFAPHFEQEGSHSSDDARQSRASATIAPNSSAR